MNQDTDTETTALPTDFGARKRVIVLGALLVALGAIALYRLIPRGPEPLEARLRGDADEVVAALDQALEPLGEPERMAMLLRYAGDPSPNLRYAAIDALGSMTGGVAADAVLAAFEDSSSAVRQRAVEVMHKLDPERGYDLLLRALRDEDDWIREAAAMQLMLFLRDPDRDPTRAYPSLIAAMRPSDVVVTRTAVHTLSKATGKPWRMRAGMTDQERDAVLAKWRAWWASQQSSQAAMLPDPVRPSRRDRSPDFHIRDLDGRTHSRASMRGKITLLHFYATWCGPCDHEVRGLAELERRYAPDGVAMIGIALKPHDAATVRKWCAERNVRFPQALADSRTLESFGHIHEVPVSVLLDRGGDIRYRWEGEREASTFEAALKRLIAGD